MRATREQLRQRKVPFPGSLSPCPNCGGGWWVEAIVGPDKGTFGWIAHEEGCAGPALRDAQGDRQ